MEAKALKEEEILKSRFVMSCPTGLVRGTHHLAFLVPFALPGQPKSITSIRILSIFNINLENISVCSTVYGTYGIYV